MGDIQEWGAVSSCGHPGVSVRTDPFQYTGGGAVVQGQLPGAVPTQPNPHGPQQEGHTRDRPLNWRDDCHIMVSLGLQKSDVTRSQPWKKLKFEEHAGASRLPGLPGRETHRERGGARCGSSACALLCDPGYSAQPYNACFGLYATQSAGQVVSGGRTEQL